MYSLTILDTRSRKIFAFMSISYGKDTADRNEIVTFKINIINYSNLKY